MIKRVIAGITIGAFFGPVLIVLAAVWIQFLAGAQWYSEAVSILAAAGAFFGAMIGGLLADDRWDR